MFLYSFKEKDHPERYPAASLALIDALISDAGEGWGWPDLRVILNRINAAQPSLAGDPRFLRLQALLQQFE